MSETLTLTTAEITPQISTTDYRVVRLWLGWDEQLIVIQLRGTNGERREFRYEGQTAIDLMVALNKANLTIKSLQRRLLERLVADGFLAGAVTGAPE
jgi:hypothetical protein